MNQNLLLKMEHLWLSGKGDGLTPPPWQLAWVCGVRKSMWPKLV